MKEMNAMFAGRCRACGGDIAVGDPILWSKSAGSRHKACPAKPVPATIPAEAVIKVWVSRRSRPSPNSDVGRVFRAVTRDGGQVVRVLVQTAVFIPEDGEDLGLDFDRGWRVTLHCRLATAEEAAPIEATERAEAETLAKERATDKARRTLFAPEDGEYVRAPEGQHQMLLRGTRVKWRDGFTITGGGEEIVVEEGGEHVWWLLNNGADGDCWGNNNIMTGGAGAIGRRYPATPERLAFVRSLPGGEFVGLTKTERRREVIRAYRAQVEHLRPEFAGLFDDDPIDAVEPLPAAWLLADERGGYQPVLVGMTPNNAFVYLAIARAPGSPSPHDNDIFMSTDGRLYLQYEATPARIAAVRSLWPSWVGSNAHGRYVVKSAWGGVAENAAEALLLAHHDKMPVTSVEETRGVHLIYASAGVVELRAGILLWSDGEAMRVRACGFTSHRRHDPRGEPFRSRETRALEAAGVPAPPMPHAWSMELDPAAEELLTIALRQELWRRDQRFEQLFTVVSIERTQIAQRGEIVPGRSSDEVVLYQLAVRHEDGRTEPFWLVHGRYVDIGGGDADAGDDLALFDAAPLAREAFQALYA